MNIFNKAFARLYAYWFNGELYGFDGEPIEYKVEEQIEDWEALNEEYVKVSEALAKAIERRAEE